ncbi:AraC family transcriptional regulator [Curtobacterium sp. MCPF17_052]|nr:AraC family transcriptional regulator [Curtobacterium sp. MCPF17_052]WIB11954.1 AraC family transcriptional regulator [Curtobacterium sp. MCPF17_052]
MPDGPVLFDQQDERVARHEPLRRLLGEVSPTLMDDRVRGAMRTALNRRLATVVLDTFPLRDRGDDVPTASRLRDAIAFVEEHARDRPSVPAIAAAAGLSERGLQEVFARTLGVTPNGFLRDQRLDEVRRELLRGASPNSVLEVARRWRFTNPSRFATAYRARFGGGPFGDAPCGHRAAPRRPVLVADPPGGGLHRGAPRRRLHGRRHRRGRRLASPAAPAALQGGTGHHADRLPPRPARAPPVRRPLLSSALGCRSRGDRLRTGGSDHSRYVPPVRPSGRPAVRPFGRSAVRPSGRPRRPRSGLRPRPAGLPQAPRAVSDR